MQITEFWAHSAVRQSPVVDHTFRAEAGCLHLVPIAHVQKTIVIQLISSTCLCVGKLDCGEKEEGDGGMGISDFRWVGSMDGSMVSDGAWGQAWSWAWKVRMKVSRDMILHFPARMVLCTVAGWAYNGLDTSTADSSWFIRCSITELGLDCQNGSSLSAIAKCKPIGLEFWVSQVPPVVSSSLPHCSRPMNSSYW
jgi:hypothetical protein